MIIEPPVMPEADPRPSRPTAPAIGGASNVFVWIAVAAATVAAVIGSGVLLARSGLLGGGAAEDPVAIAADGQYVVFLSQIEVEPATGKDSKWDLRDGGPDVRYDIYWRGNRVFRSSVRKDTLVARWDREEVGVGDLLHGVSAEGAIKAARITMQPGDTIEFRVIDSDPFSDDEIGQWQVAVDSLKTGDQTWNAPAPGVRHAICRVARAGSTSR
jgi:hypothetical protein